ncbi:hypothetical protein L218DRAFT_295682 [Marasmius fiardii PR-910]|nr:hypothetical protein L218DRAFT_295682 [Marasmius fiardii PR-910]
MAQAFSIDKLLGAAFIGYAVSCVILGIFLGQVLRYWTRYQDDKPFYKILVIAIGMLELAHHAFISHLLYYAMISHSSDIGILLNSQAPWTGIFQILIGTVIGTIVKICFSLRVWRFSKHNVFVTFTIVLLVAAELALSIIYVIWEFRLGFFKYLPKTKGIGSLALGCGVVVDVAIAMVLWYYLRRLKAGYQCATTVILRISIYAVSTGIVTSAVGLATLLCFYFMPDNFIFVGVFFLLSKVYGVSLLAALNTRRTLFPQESMVYNGNSESDSFTPLPPASRASRIPRYRSRRERSINAPYSYSSRASGPAEPSRYYSHSTSGVNSSDLGGHGSRFSVVST